MLLQMQELVARVAVALPAPWNKKIGRPKACGLYRAVEIACMYLRHKGTEEFLGDVRGVSQSTVSRIVTTLVSVVKVVVAEFVPDAKQAMEWVTGRVCLVDGTITPCWSYRDHRELWSRQHATTGSPHTWSACSTAVPSTFPIPCLARPTTRRHSPKPRWQKSWNTRVAELGTKATRVARASSHHERSHSAGELSKTDNKSNAEISALRAPVERLVAHFKSWRIFHTDYRRPYATYQEAYDATRALFFFSIIWGFE